MRNATAQDIQPGKGFGILKNNELEEVYVESGPDTLGNYCVVSSASGASALVSIDQIFLLPLDVLEGKPIYPGDELYHRAGKYITIVDKHNSMLRSLGGSFIFKESLTWSPPHTGWVNVYSVDGHVSLGPVHSTREEALSWAFTGALDCIMITWKGPSI